MAIKKITKMFIKKFKDDIDEYQKAALEAARNGDVDKCALIIKKQGEAIYSLIKLIEADKKAE